MVMSAGKSSESEVFNSNGHSVNDLQALTLRKKKKRSESIDKLIHILLQKESKQKKKQPKRSKRTLLIATDYQIISIYNGSLPLIRQTK